MKFRTPVEIEPSPVKVSHGHPPVFIGSCFSEHIAERLRRDGINALSNPGGAMYNPASISSLLLRAIREERFSEAELVAGPRGHHLLALATPFSGPDPEKIIKDANTVLETMLTNLHNSTICFLTLGTAYVYEWNATGAVAGNCHKLPAGLFSRRRLSVQECVCALSPAIAALSDLGIHTVLTVSPVRHTADTLHGNTLSKSTLHLASDALCGAYRGKVSYFPAYEALVDDLRDYRFTAPDMKHPTEQAADYVYELFRTCYFTPETEQEADIARRAYARAAHRSIL